MAANITSSPFFFIHPNPNPIKKTSKSVLMLANKDSPNTSSSLIRVGSPIKIQKVFEDKSRGIVCYLDDNGEITCEGFDEGPRLHQGSSRFSCYQRGNQDLIDLLKRSLLQVTDGGKFN
ncbi:hypothetical protein L1987_31458 [Smallanthus sonchifolius]|uniref:Uncharacterized protein n=1 Tax=Smallanthus sonchifolius TaxID=185202 RepID=A0ACB9I6K5_9ASTR|nr:hypothetical protein L1987_31458 [Smallanthus sonchifolius]